MNVRFVVYCEGDYRAFWGGDRWNIEVRHFWLNSDYMDLMVKRAFTPNPFLERLKEAR